MPLQHRLSTPGAWATQRIAGPGEMGLFSRARDKATGTFLGRLARDRRGNTIAIMAAALVPMAGMVGGGLDMSRMYITKTRLQHACDAGALAGRRSMGGGAWDNTDETAANQFFDANYVTGSFGSTTLTRSYTENAGKVSGTASATVPMTLMRILRIPTQTLTVTCDAEMKLPNTDVMFVLDTTGSMNCVAGDTDCTNNDGVSAPGSRLEGLKVAVKCFYQIVAQLDVDDVTCAAGEPSGGTSEQVQVRFGFMPYSSNVNVGRLLPTSYFVDNWEYQTRKRNGTAMNWKEWKFWRSGFAEDICPTFGNTNIRQFRKTRDEYSGYENYRFCSYQDRDLGPEWSYGRFNVPVSRLKSGTDWNTSFTLPIADDEGPLTVTWEGCIEERDTVMQASYDPIPNDEAGSKAWDLDIDLEPTVGNPKSLWAPALPRVVYYRGAFGRNDYDDVIQAPFNSALNYYMSDTGLFACPTQAEKLKEWDEATKFKDYVNSLKGVGNTYHDIGMLWGARFASPTGIFKADNAKAEGGGDIQRHIIFMTDGDSQSFPCDYNAYGVPWFDKRQTTDVGPADECSQRRQPLVDQIDKRLETLCKAVKAKGFTLWVISYGVSVNSATETRLSNCASPANAVTSTHYFKADNATTLQEKFAEIANNISQLRLTQ